MLLPLAADIALTVIVEPRRQSAMTPAPDTVGS